MADHHDVTAASKPPHIAALEQRLAQAELHIAALADATRTLVDGLELRPTEPTFDPERLSAAARRAHELLLSAGI